MKLYPKVVLYMLLAVLISASGIAWGSASVPDDIGASLSQPDGSTISIPNVEILWAGKSKRSFGIREFGERVLASEQPRLVVVSTQPLPVSSFWSCDVSGVLSTYSGVSRRDGTPISQRVLIVSPENVAIYCSPKGYPILWGKQKSLGIDWSYKRTLADIVSERNISTASASTMEEEPPLPLMPDSLYAPGAVYCDTIAEAKAQYSPTARVMVELHCRPFSGATSTQFTLGQDSPTDSITVYYSGSSSLSGRINRMAGTIQKDASDNYWIEVDSGPNWLEGDDAGGVQSIAEGPTIAYARTLQQGATTPTLTGKVVTANRTDFPDALYVQEPDRSAGIRVLYSGTYYPNRGDVVSVDGTIQLGDDGEREIDAGTTGVTFEEQGEVPVTLGMAQRSLGGDWFNALTPGVSNPAGSGTGLYNKSLLVKGWGRVTAVDATNKFFYIDDGTGFADGSGNTGVKVSWDWPTAGKQSIMPPAVGWYVSVAGISSSDTSDSGATYYRVLRPRDPNDITTHSIGNPSTEVQLPAWAEAARPTDSFPVAGTGPSSADSVDLATGAGEHDGGPDIIVNNPNGPRISYSRKYRSTLAEADIASAGLSRGWVHNYDLSITGSIGVWDDLTLTYPNGAQETISVDAPGGNPVFQPNGAPYVVSGQPSGTVGLWNSVTLTYSDDSSWTFTPTNPSVPTRLLLTRISDVANNYISVERVSATDERLLNIRDNTNQAMLSFAYPDVNTATVSDVSDAGNPRTITYSFDSVSHWLSGISQVNSPSNRRWSYTYTSVGGVPYLTWVEVPDPIDGVGMTGHPINYDGSGHVASLEDANGNRRAFTYLGDRTAVEVRDNTGKLVESWTQKIGSGNVNAGVIDASGNSTTILYNSLYKPTSITNKNNQTVQISYDADLSYPNYGRVRTITEPTSTSSTGRITTYSYNADNPLRIASKQTGSKTATAFDYYAVGHQWQGRVATVYAPTPGTAGNPTRVRSDYTYTTKGNIATITTPAQNDTANAVVTAVYDYTEDPNYSLSGVTEALGRPLRATIYDGLPGGGNILYRAHYRYDSLGRITDVTDSYVSNPPDIANSRRTSYEYNTAGQVTRVLSPATGANPAQRAYTLYNYLYPGGPLSSVQFYDESGNLLQDSTITPHWGNEGELLEQTGAQDATFHYDAQYRQIGLTDGRSNTTNYGYDLIGNLTAVNYPSGPGATFDYDPDGNLSQRVDGESQATTYQRNSTDGSLSGVSYQDTPTVDFDYDGYGRLVTMTDPTGTVSYEFDDNDMLTTVRTTYKKADGSNLPEKVISYTYYPDGSRKSMTIPGPSGTQTFNYYYEYDGSVGPGRVVRITMPWVGTPIRCYYDRNGQVVRQTQVRSSCQ